MNRLLLRKARRDLARRRSQIVAVAVTVFLGILLFSANHDAAANLGASYETLYDRLRFGDVWATGVAAGTVSDQLADDPDVTAVEERTRLDTSLRIGDHQIRGTVIGVPSDRPPLVNRLLVLEGEGLDVAAVAAGEPVAVLEQHGWNAFESAPGDRIAIHGDGGWLDVTLVGGAASAEYVWLAPSRQQIFTVADEFAVVFVPEALARTIAPDAPRQVVATVRDHDPAIAARLASEVTELGASEAYTRAEQASNLALQSDVTGFEQLSFLFPLLFLTVAGMAAFVLLSRLVRTERQQIGMMVANGMSVRSVRWHYTSHAIVAVVAGAVPGLVGGVLLGRWISGRYTDFVDVPITVIRFSVSTVLWSLGFTVVVALLAGGLPARAAARIQPAEAMRPPTPPASTRRSLVERIWPGELPGWGRMVVRNVTRSRRRFVSTVIGVVLAMMLVVTSFGMSDTVFAMVDRAFTDVDRRDLTLVFDRDVTLDDLAALTGRATVSTAERFAEKAVTISANGSISDQLLQAFETDTVAHGFSTPLPAAGIVLGSTARSALGVVIGDSVDVGVLGTVVSATVAGFVEEPIPSISYVSIPQWQAWGAHVDSATVVLVDRSDHSVVRGELSSVPGVTAVVDQQAEVEAVRQLMGLTYVFVGMMVVFALVMAVALVYNMVSVSLAERATEVATLRANGVDRRFVRRTLSAEHLLTVAAGVVPGTALGWLVARQLMRQFETESFAFTFVLHARSIVLAIALVLVAAMIAQWPGLRALDRLDLAVIVRERSE